MNLIIEKSKYVKWYTYLDDVFQKIPELRQYHWLISNLQVNYCLDSRLHADPVMINGEDFNEIVQKQKIQFIWAVLSGFKKRIDTFPIELPYADGNRDLWVPHFPRGVTTA